MSSLSISAAWDEAKAILTRDARLYLSVALALIVLPQVVLAVAGSPVDAGASMLSKLVYAAVILLGLVAQVALNRLAIGPSVTVRDSISQGLVRVIPVFLVLALAIFLMALLAAVIALGLGAAGLIVVKSPGQASPALIALLVVLAALVFAVVQLIFPIAAVETGNPIRLVSRSWQLARRQYPRLLAFVVIVFVGVGLAVIASQVGLGSVIVLLLGRPNPGSMSALMLGLVAGILQAVFTVITAVMLARIYVQLAGREPQASVPSSGI
jgi:hypothetical protein